MAALTTQFNEAKRNVEPSDDDKNSAPGCHEEVRDALDDNDYLASLGIKSVLIGSYRRNVSIRRVKDVDVLCRLPLLPDVDPDIGPLALLNRFETALHDSLGEERVARQARSFQVSFDDSDMYVDVVPARPCGDHWEIPGRDGTWEETNPEKLKDLTETMNAAHADRYVPTVKLVRQVRRAHLGKQPGGLYFEVATYHAFASGMVTGSNTAEVFCTALERIPVELRTAKLVGLADPTLFGKVISTRASDAELDKAIATFDDLATDARAALDEEDRCTAARQWREILGQNEDGWVFPMPDDCDEEAKSSIAAAPIRSGNPRVPKGDARFAS